eukprot:6302684-Amphidinium_carterae.1
MWAARRVWSSGFSTRAGAKEASGVAGSPAHAARELGETTYVTWAVLSAPMGVGPTLWARSWQVAVVSLHGCRIGFCK